MRITTIENRTKPSATIREVHIADTVYVQTAGVTIRISVEKDEPGLRIEQLSDDGDILGGEYLRNVQLRGDGNAFEGDGFIQIPPQPRRVRASDDGD